MVVWTVKANIFFPSPKTGRKLNYIKKGFRKAVEQTGLRDFRFHDLRHSAATRMADAGADAFTLATILGHSSIQMTPRYTHTTGLAIRRAVENLDSNSDFGNGLVTRNRLQSISLP